MITKTFEYPALKRVEIESARYYLDSLGNPVPSVTTVLSKTSNKSDGIDQWRARVGNEEAERIIKLSTDIGSAVHEAIENYLNNNSHLPHAPTTRKFYFGSREVYRLPHFGLL